MPNYKKCRLEKNADFQLNSKTRLSKLKGFKSTLKFLQDFPAEKLRFSSRKLRTLLESSSVPEPRSIFKFFSYVLVAYLKKVQKMSQTIKRSSRGNDAFQYPGKITPTPNNKAI